MSNIIKCTSVVDNREDRPGREQAPESGGCAAILKRRALCGAAHILAGPMPSKDAYLDEINRVRLELEEAKKELRAESARVEEIRRAVRQLEEEREKLKKYEGLNIEEEVVAILQKAERDAEEIRARAEEESREIVESLKGQGYIDGLEQGANEARQQVREENRKGTEAVARLLEELSGLRDDLARRSEGEIIDLILAVAEKIVGRQIKEDPKTVADMLRDVMEQSRREAYIKIIVSSDLMPIEAKASEQVRRIIGTLGHQVDIQVDGGGEPGGLLVETPSGFTDLSVATQLRNLSETLHEVRLE